jgi:hypothetical protein
LDQYASKKYIHNLDLRKANFEVNADADSEMCSAVAKGLENSHSKRYYLPDAEIPIVLMDRYGKRCSRATDVLKSFALHIVPFHWKPLSVSTRVIQQYVTGVT